MTSDLDWQSSSAPIHGAIGDINTMRISPDYLGFAQDVVIDNSGVLRSRGGFQSVTSDTFASNVPQLLIISNTGAFMLTKVSGGQTTSMGTSNFALTGFATLSASGFFTTVTNQLEGDSSLMPTAAKFADNKGAVIAFDPSTNLSTSVSGVHLWGGNAVTTSDTTTGTAASTIGSKSIAGVGTSWTTALEGCYLFIGAAGAAIYVGQVDQVTSTTAILLKKGALKTIAAAAPCFKASRPAQHMVYKGRITTNTASTVVVGSNTKFTTSGPGGSGSVYLTNTTTNLFRYSDGAFIGQITSVQNDTTLTLNANAAIALVNEEYYITNPQFAVNAGNSGPTFVFEAGSVARYADRFWYGCYQVADPSIKATNTAQQLVAQGQNNIAFTKKGDPECIDFDPSAGDFIPIPTTHQLDRVRGLCATRGGLVVFRTRDVYLITGYSPETFRAIKIADEGIPMVLAFDEYNEGVIWAGAKSVWYYDGTRVVDLLNNSVKKFYQRYQRSTSINTPLSMATSNDHVLLSWGAPTYTGANTTWPVKNSTGTANRVTMVLNMLNGAITFFSNLLVTGSTYSDGLGTDVILARGSTSTFNTTGYLVDGSRIFTDSNASADNFDALTMITMVTGQASIGPQVMWESTKLVMGDAARLKMWNNLLMNYSSDVSMTVSFIMTNNTTIDFPDIGTGTVSSDVFPVSSNVGLLRRSRFVIRSPQMMFRVYQTNAASATSQRFKCFWWSVSGKRMRQGRPQP